MTDIPEPAADVSDVPAGEIDTEGFDPRPDPLPGGEGTERARGLSRAIRLLCVALAVVAVAVAVKIVTGSNGNAGAVALSGGVSSAYKFTSGDPAPDFTLHLVDGRNVSLSDYRGHPVLINFWATWCIPCRSEMPDIGQVYSQRKDRGLVVLAVNVHEPVEPVRGYTQQLGLLFPILLDSTGEVTERYGVQALPTSFFVDPNGRIASFNMGPLNHSALERRLDAIPQ